MNWYIQVLKKYADFTGRARRSEYWNFTLINVLFLIALKPFCEAISNIGLKALSGIPSMQVLVTGIIATVLTLVILVFCLGVIIPSIAVTARRLHDTGRHGWWMLLAVIPVVGTIILLVFMFLGSKPTANRYGPNPKAVPASV